MHTGTIRPIWGWVASCEGMLYLLEGKIDEAMTLARDIRQRIDKDALTDLLLALREIKSNNYGWRHGDAAIRAFDTGSGQLWQPLISAWLDVGQQ